MKVSLDVIKNAVCSWINERYGIIATPEDLHTSINPDSNISVLLYLKGDVTYMAQYALGNPNAKIKFYKIGY